MQTGEIVIYQTKDGESAIDVRLENETVWLNLNQMSTLFDRDKSVISRHISNIFNENELDRTSVVAKNATTGSDEKIYQVDFFNLDVIISVGYRVKSGLWLNVFYYGNGHKCMGGDTIEALVVKTCL